jgi:hypothetical protein
MDSYTFEKFSSCLQLIFFYIKDCALARHIGVYHHDFTVNVIFIFFVNVHLYTFARIGEYSYIGDDGKTYTVKYSAGVDGFRYTRTLLKKINFAHFLIYQEIFLHI